MSNYFKTHTADEIIDKAWNTFIPKGIPESRYQLKNFKKGMDKANKKKGISQITKSRIKEGYSYIKKWKKRHFVGSYWLLVISILSIAWFGYQMYNRYKTGQPILLLETGGTRAMLANAFGFFYLFGFLTYFWSQRAPSWMIYKYKLKSGGDGKDFEPARTRFIMVNHQGKTMKDRSGKTKIFTKESWLSVIPIFIIKYLTLPFVTLFGFLRYYVFYI